MTPDEINIAIAKVCGYELLPLPQNTKQKTWQMYGVTVLIPNYCNSLDAMHEAEKVLDDDQYHTFTLRLSEIGWASFPNQISNKDYKNRLRIFCSPTAAQRCEAFLRTLNLWKD